MRSPELPGRVAAALGRCIELSLNKFYFDEIFCGVLVAPLRRLAWLSNWFDRTIIDPIVDWRGDDAAVAERGAACGCTTGSCRRTRW